MKWRADLTTLRLFVAVCEESSITRAAEREAIAPSAISKRIAETESTIGLPLLLRGGRGVSPTPAGLVLLEHARRILDSTGQLESELNDFASGNFGSVRVFANISSIVEFVPRDLSLFLAENPRIRVDLQERVSSDVAQGLREGQAELGICLNATDLWGLQQFPYGSDELKLIVHPGHRLAARDSVSFDEIMEFELVGLQTGSRMTTFLAGLAARKGRDLRYRTYVSTYEAACHLIAEDLGVAVLSAEAVRIPQTALGLKAIQIDEPWAQRRMVLCVQESKALSDVALKLFDHLRARGEARCEAADKVGPRG
ncbi:LysR family transcriptional regulator [Variovorax sp. J31P207]|uniref:LysR family transcriptional regulator n=1 Tax=Variovorax sp. J31P207 TaxID=3053510 RepID=UPI002577A3D5|nr:LysR family transcriptional regulator [Variovorax sp. J31P207]MDM0072488.1 LysR family transcriptional regulator [Variovorax sp. J31P207]